MATLQNAITFARTQTQTDANGLTDANAIVFANEALLDLHRRFILKGIDASQLQESYRDGAVPSTDGDGSTFLYPTDMFFLKAIEVNFTDTAANNYRKAEQVDVSNLPAGRSFSWLRKNASQQKPMFDDRGDWYEIFPAFTGGDNTSQAIRIFYYLEPTEYTATTDTLTYPVTLDYRVLGWRIGANYLYSLEKYDQGDRLMTRYEERINQLTRTLGRGSQQPIKSTPIQLTGWEF